jgi:hypothetical protein
MSEAPEVGQDEAPIGEDAFEAARLAEEADEGAPEVEEEAGDEPAAKAVDWEKRAHDKEGLAAKERAKRREAERQLREVNERVARLEATAKPKTDDEDLLAVIAALRDDDEDPITDLAQVKKALKLFQQQQAREDEQTSAQSAEERAFVQLANSMAEAEADFADDHPDYKEAQEHFKAARRAEFEDMGYAGRELEAELAKDLIGLVRRAINGGRDPAEVVYNLAKKRGFQSGKAQADAKLKEIAAAAQAGRSAPGGRTGETRLTPDAVNKLKGAAYDSAWAKLREQERRAG